MGLLHHLLQLHTIHILWEVDYLLALLIHSKPLHRGELLIEVEA
jgi:hypothetical protein